LGTYEGVPIIGQGFGESHEKKTPFFYLTIKPGDYERTITFYLKSEKGAARMRAALEAAGLPLFDEFSELDLNNEQHLSFVGLEITCVCSHETSNGKTYDQWDLPYGGGKQIEPLCAEGIRRLDAIFGKPKPPAAKAAAAVAPAAEARPAPKRKVTQPKPPAAKAAEEGEAGGGDSDIPF
jgi:hypothetical protein